eukprot:CAMPEP_0174335496 /NCGR_PEP_ID=MMETSP0810-20121108/20833_1 /TAXON_ID=73025 ORGANISM="Eutreptiella gymnastica-like, Strain CCMP1594" /NCGR_SAMPLE_ID=MMETSP0810 /ASSEMBLY_ACC=CAM_ASM_000659 /LENGTH=61 /DNA_ID=CAMNT_0015453917 /DNA_START=72 /DNA_END=257 /DNA_ORIENTATION=+
MSRGCGAVGGGALGTPSVPATKGRMGILKRPSYAMKRYPNPRNPLEWVPPHCDPIEPYRSV